MSSCAATSSTSASAPRSRSPRGTQWTSQLPPGLGAPKEFGPTVAETPAIPFVDEISLANAAGRRRAAVDGRLLREGSGADRARRAGQRAAAGAGDSEGLVDASAAGMLDTTGTVRFAASQTTQGRQTTSAGAGERRSPAHRLQPQARRALGNGPRELRLRGDRDRRAAREGPQRRAAAGLPWRETADQTVAVLGGVADIEASGVRQRGQLRPGRPPVLRLRRRHDDGLVRRRLRRPARAAAAGRSAEARHEQPRHPGPALHRPGHAHITKARAHLLRRRHGREHRRRRPDPLVADEGGPGRDLPAAARSPRSSSRSSRPATARSPVTTDRAASAWPSWPSRASPRPRPCACRPTSSRPPAPTARASRCRSC